MTVQLEDTYNNVVNAAVGGVTVALATTSAGGTFAPASVTIAVGTSTASFKYTDTKAGSPALTASSGVLIAATQVETVNAAAASKLVFTTAAQTIPVDTYSMR